MAYIGNSPTTTAFVTDSFSGNASTTAFTMSVAPANPSSALVAISGILQDPTTYSVSGTTLTFSSAPPVGTGTISVRYLGIPASGVTTTAYRTVTEFTATAGQTTFSPPSYTVGFITVYRNGVRLGTADFTATSGTSVVLVNACTVGDLVTTEAMLVSSVVNALPSTGGTVAGNMVVSGTLSASGSAILGTSAASLALSVKSPSDYRAAIFETASLAGPSVQIKGSKTYELRSTNTGASEGAGLFFIYDKDNEASRLTIDSSGRLMVNTFTADAKLSIHTDGTNTTAGYGIALVNDAGGGNTWTIQCGDYALNNGRFTIYDKTNNRIALKIDASTNYFTVPGVYSLTSGSGANVYVDSNGILQRSTSSLKYKTEVETATHGLTDLLKLRPVTYKGKNDGDKIFGGLIAEEVHEAGLTEFVEYADDGTPDALAYGNMISLAVKSIQELKAIVDAQAVEIAALKAK